MDNEKISVLVVEPEKKPYAKEISSGLSSLQHEVGGYIQAVYPYEERLRCVAQQKDLGVFLQPGAPRSYQSVRQPFPKRTAA